MVAAAWHKSVEVLGRCLLMRYWELEVLNTEFLFKKIF
jgi:hypothetical protein